jgi:hypothetical protein
MKVAPNGLIYLLAKAHIFLRLLTTFSRVIPFSVPLEKRKQKLEIFFILIRPARVELARQHPLLPNPGRRCPALLPPCTSGHPCHDNGHLPGALSPLHVPLPRTTFEVTPTTRRSVPPPVTARTPLAASPVHNASRSDKPLLDEPS